LEFGKRVFESMAFRGRWFTGRLENIFWVLQGTVIYLRLYKIERRKIELESRR